MFQSLVQRMEQARRDNSFFFAPLLPEQVIREAYGGADQSEREGTTYCFVPANFSG
jgi:hypothetical protein